MVASFVVALGDLVEEEGVAVHHPGKTKMASTVSGEDGHEGPSDLSMDVKLCDGVSVFLSMTALLENR